jgi:hypothetical protein
MASITSHDSVRREIVYNILTEFGIPMKTTKANKNMSKGNL